MKRINKIAEIILLLIMTMIFLTLMYCKQETPKPKIAKIVAIEPVIVEEKKEEVIEENAQNNEEIVEEVEENAQLQEKSVEENIQNAQNNENIVQNSYETRMTSYYPEEGETTTATGLGIYDFNVNDNGWFTYNGKLVVATASNRLGYTEMRTYNLYDEIVLNIDGIDYDAVVLDVCGFCQIDNRIDLFVSNIDSIKDTNVIVKIK